MYELGSPWSHIHGVCHRHKTVWHLSSGGAADPTWPTLAQLRSKGYLMTRETERIEGAED